MLQILKNANLETAEVVLGKAVGERFQLKLVWGTDGSLQVSVDGTVKATVTGIDLNYTGEALAILAAAAVVILVIRKKRASAPVMVADDAEEIAAEEAPAEENENEVKNEDET